MKSTFDKFSSIQFKDHRIQPEYVYLDCNNHLAMKKLQKIWNALQFNLFLPLIFCVINQNLYSSIQYIILEQIMSYQRPADEAYPQFEIFKEIKNLKLKQDKTQFFNRKKETLPQNQQIFKVRKHKTLPSSALKNYRIINHFENLVFSKVNDKVIKQFIKQLYAGVKYAVKSLKSADQNLIAQKRVHLKEVKGSKKKFLFLDLDQTLIFTWMEKTNNNATNQLTFDIRIRPYVQEFLQNLSKYYDIYVFTAATKAYAQAVIEKLNYRKKYIKDFLHREHCFMTQKQRMIKDLRIIQNRSLKDMILVDNKVQSFGSQLDNGIPILQFNGSGHDKQLIKLEKILIKMANSQDVRLDIQHTFKLRQLGQLTKEELIRYLKYQNLLSYSQKDMRT